MELLNLSDQDLITLFEAGDPDETFFTLNADDLVTMAGPSQIPPHLRAYWLGPEGSTRVGGWGNKGSWTKCTVELRKEGVPGRMVKGECTNLYHEATGRYPNQKKVTTDVDTVEAGLWKKKDHPQDPNSGRFINTEDVIDELTPGEHRKTQLLHEDIGKSVAHEDSHRSHRQRSADDDFALTTLAVQTDAPVEAAAEASPANPRWHGVLTIEGGESGDGRMFADGSLDWDQPPLKLMYQRQTSGGHSESVYVGNIDKVFRKGDHILGEGDIDMQAEYGPEAHRLMKEKRFNGVSVDVDSVKNADVELVYEDGVEAAGGMAAPSMQIYHKGRIRGATLVAFPAFVEASLELDDADCATCGDETTGVPLVSASSASMNDRPDDDFAYIEPGGSKDSSGKTTPRSLRHFPIYDAVHVRNALARMNQSPFGAKAKPKIMAAAKKFGITVSDMQAALADGVAMQPIVASSHVIELHDLPPARWFDEPTDVQLSGALTITDEGRIYGLLVPPRTLHRANGRTEPAEVNYAHFMKGETIVEGGARVITGPITMSCGHAPTENYGTYAARVQHYDNTCSVFADVRVGRRADGATWVAGAVKKFATAEQISTAMSCTLSGDWQPDRNNPGQTELIAALLVPVPGFPMARAAASVRMENGLVTASTTPLRYASPDDMLETASVVIDPNVLALTKRVLAASIGRDADSRRRELRAQLTEV